MVIHHCHLAATYTCTNIAHAVVEAYLLVLIVRIALAILRGIHHNLAPFFFISCHQGTTARSGNHLVAIERQHSILAKCAQYLTFPTATETLSGIFNHGDVVAVSNLHNLINLVRHTVQCHWHDGFRLLSGLSNAVFNGLFQQFRVHVPGVLLAIDKHGRSTEVGNRMTRSTESKALHQHLIAWLHATVDKSQMHRSRS